MRKMYYLLVGMIVQSCSLMSMLEESDHEYKELSITFPSTVFDMAKVTSFDCGDFGTHFPKGNEPLGFYGAKTNKYNYDKRERCEYVFYIGNDPMAKMFHTARSFKKIKKYKKKIFLQDSKKFDAQEYWKKFKLMRTLSKDVNAFIKAHNGEFEHSEKNKKAFCGMLWYFYTQNKLTKAEKKKFENLSPYLTWLVVNSPNFELSKNDIVDKSHNNTKQLVYLALDRKTSTLHAKKV